MADDHLAVLTSAQPIGAWVEALGAKKPTPGGGAAAAVAAAIGTASGAMAAIYTTRKKDEESGVAAEAKALAESLNAAAARMLKGADDDATAYAALQSTWKKDSALTEEEKVKIQAEALDVPVRLVKLCHEQAAAVQDFLPRCNPSITSDAKVALHLLAGAARAAYQTVLVNSPPDAIKAELRLLLDEMSEMEKKVLE
mmetsp:Transcript_10318/g.27518  ORF Transcript_10318/g.27518 Transcript_10318/m.27518 type:complete len:198 (-) Transcript_10318:57-650(-)